MERCEEGFEGGDGGCHEGEFHSAFSEDAGDDGRAGGVGVLGWCEVEESCCDDGYESGGLVLAMERYEVKGPELTKDASRTH